MGVHQPYLYDSDLRDSRSPEKPFDPKAITRASWEPPPRKPKQQKGPYVSFNRHPDAHEVPTGRTSKFRPLSGSTKWWIKSTRFAQLFLRIFEMIGGGCLLTLMILISNVDPLTAWVMRIAPGVVAISCVYAIWHFIRPANSRPPASSAAYQLFAGVMDLSVIPLYAFGIISVNNHGSEWKLIFDGASPQLLDALVQSERYLLISAGSLHVVSLCISAYLAFIFHRIASMPPDLNPLESHLTSRVKQHKRNKSSVATSYTAVSDYDSKRLSTPLENYRNSGAAYEDLSRPPSIPFMHTRAGSRDSFASSKRDSHFDFPSRQYQITPGNSPRNSVAGSLADLKRLSTPRASYTEVPLHETGAPSPTASSRPSSITIAPGQQQQGPFNASPTRIAKFTEAWYASESLINRTQERQRAMNAEERKRHQSGQSQQYEVVNQRYNFDDSDSDSDRENNDMQPNDSDLEDELMSSPIDVSGHLHPNPLRLNPVPAPLKPNVVTRTTENGSPVASRQKTPFRPPPPPPRQSIEGTLSEVSPNARRRVSGSQDIADASSNNNNNNNKPSRAPSFWRRSMPAPPRNRNSSIQPDGDFYAKPYGELKPATPPIMLGSNGIAAGKRGERQVSSGNDFGGGDLGAAGTSYRRNVSGKVAEEGLAGRGPYSRYSVLNLD
ncbi:hypothetical protein M426DRAFT_321876 [Hypoxylon sp. CI-4A]|nr:hypothetical protein M426DRAFT_321876 [Hypoxylon sp. CI-4A]